VRTEPADTIEVMTDSGVSSILVALLRAWEAIGVVVELIEPAEFVPPIAVSTSLRKLTRSPWERPVGVM